MILLILATMAAGIAIPNEDMARAQTESPERFWVAGRYDGNRVIVYFDAVEFNGTLPKGAAPLAPAVVEGFFDPVEITASYINSLGRGPDSERFSIGDRYDLLLGNGDAATVTLTTLVGCETDEGVGNDSFIGALATINGKYELPATGGYYAVRRRSAVPKVAGMSTRKMGTRFSELIESPAPFDVESRVMSLLNERVKTIVTDNERQTISGRSPELSVQSFRLADGSVRYYARAIWMPERISPKTPPFAAGAWLVASPETRILAMEPDTVGYTDLLPALRNVVDLGNDRTGLIVSISRGESVSLDLVDYRDGRRVDQMRKWQSISFGE